MRVRMTAGVPRLLAFVTAVLVVFSSAPLMIGPPGMAVPLVMTTLLVAVLALIVAVAHTCRPSVRTALAWGRAGCVVRTPARQCDPDAAGHVRSRAPGSRYFCS